MNNAFFGKTLENVREHRNIKLITRERKRNYLVSEPNHHSTKLFTENLLVTKMRKTQILMNKSVYLGYQCGESAKYGYRQLHCSCKNRRYLQRYCRRC